MRSFGFGIQWLNFEAALFGYEISLLSLETKLFALRADHQQA